MSHPEAEKTPGDQSGSSSLPGSGVRRNFSAPPSSKPALPPELLSAIEKIQQENRLFRQHSVNHHTAAALRYLADSFQGMAEQVEAKDQALTTLFTQLNAFHEHARQQQLTADSVAKSLTQELSAMRGSHARLEAEGVESRSRIDTLLSTIRSAELRIAKLGALTEAVGTNLAQLESATQKHEGTLAEKLRDFSTVDQQLSQKLDAMGGLLDRLHQKINAQREITPETTSKPIPSSAGEALLTSIRSINQGHEKLATDVDSLRRDLSTLLEATTQIARRQESSAAVIGGAVAALDALAPTIRSHVGSPPETEVRGDPRSSKEAVQAAEAALSAETDGLYVALEARFRGPQALIRERQARYLPYIVEARKRVESHLPPPSTTPVDPLVARLRDGGGVLDLGCGRGEWLNMLKENGVPAAGVDQNRFFLQSCRERGCDVVDVDLIHFLRAAPAESFAAITSFHVIEHLPMPVFQEMLAHVFRTLRHGGVAIFETPNPNNILTSSLNFLLDPTHLRPIHPAFAQFLTESRGFTPVHVEHLHPYDPSYHVGSLTDPVAQRFNEYFYGPQDYAVIAIKP